jgi:hypothetical protein
MSTTRIFIPAGLKVGSVYLAHCGDQTLEQGLDDLNLFPAGDWAPNLAGAKTWSPEFQVINHDLASALDLMNINAQARSCLLENVYLYQRAADNLGFQNAVNSGDHIVFQLNADSLLYWEQLSASQADEAAKLTLKVCPLSISGAAPLVAVGGQTIDNPGATNAPYTLGPIKLNGTLLTGVSQVNWNNHHQVAKLASDGEASPSFVALTQCRPVITFDTTDLDTICALDPDGDDVTELISFWRRRRPNKVSYADAETQHIKLYTPSAASVGMIKWKRVSGSPAKVNCEIHLVRSAPTAALFSYAKDVAIA